MHILVKSFIHCLRILYHKTKTTFGCNDKFKSSLLGYMKKNESRSQMEPGQWVHGPTLH